MIQIRPYFAWYDLWIGIYIATKKKTVYIGIPMMGMKISWGSQGEQ